MLPFCNSSKSNNSDTGQPNLSAILFNVDNFASTSTPSTREIVLIIMPVSPAKSACVICFKRRNAQLCAPTVLKILLESGLDITFHSFDNSTQIQSEKSILPNGIYERLFKDGVLIESISIIKEKDGGWVETRFNPKGERTAMECYQKDGVPTKIIRFENDKPTETTTFKRDEDNILISRTMNSKGEMIRGIEYDENYQEKASIYIENNEIYQTKETRMHPEGFKVIKYNFLKTNQSLLETFNPEGECIAEYHFKNNEMIKSLDVEIDKKTGLRYVSVWDKENENLVIKNVYRERTCLGKYIYKNKQYVGFIECIYDSTPNHYEVLFTPNGQKISCSTYNHKNELIEYGVYENGAYRITTQKPPRNDDPNPHARGY